MRRSMMVLAACSLSTMLQGCLGTLSSETAVRRSGWPRPSVANPLGVDQYSPQAGGFGMGRPAADVPYNLPISSSVKIGVGNRPMFSPVSASAMHFAIDGATEFLCAFSLSSSPSPSPECHKEKRFDGVIVARLKKPVVSAASSRE